MEVGGGGGPVGPSLVDAKVLGKPKYEEMGSIIERGSD
jgi:hypothetical protein